jgi:hypothetical protein
MRRRLWLPLAVVIALAPGCKGMGGFASGLGKVAAGAARGVAHAAPAVARGVAKAGPALTRGVARAGGAVARGMVRGVPAALQIGEGVAEIAVSLPDIEYRGAIDGSVGALEPPSAADPCELCPVDVDCGACAGFAGYACLAAPAAAPSRCASSAPPDAPPAPAPEPAPVDPYSP